ncbi:formylmethanofuran dehydrogenase subunit C [Methyloversatilis thermotolerans]|uniref:formylmethanofuran dehydrogenase subunit C n=1 Tax=Methyloversatilis thermotolerans TaxID=1346290 RepID=UPI00037E807C|nr:formylmethanofuran dehydrogenase subunit C [Methyloversatilis thermotolerans]
MSALVLTLRSAPAQRVDAGALNPTALAGMTPADVAALTLQVGKNVVRVDALFDLSGDDPGDIVFRGDCSRFERIGAGMKSGRVTVEGDAGGYVAQRMLGGEVIVTGSTGAFCASGMKGGRVEVRGNVGDYAGGAVPGDMKGMAGGLLLVAGNAGERLGDRMRRGQILVSGNAGDYCASRMIAGTIAVAGTVGAYPGYLMKRGTLILNALPVQMLPGMVDCGAHRLGFLSLLYASWKGLPGAFGALDASACTVRRFMGDMGATGRGEMLIRG